MSKPAVLDRASLVSILRDMANKIEEGDSFEGSIEYHYWDEENGAGQGEFSAMGAYRIGNSEGQGGMMIIEKREN